MKKEKKSEVFKILSSAKNEDKDKGIDIGKLGVGVATLIAIAPMAYPSATLPSLSNIANIVTGVGYALMTGGGVYFTLTLGKELMGNDDKDNNEDSKKK